VRDLVGALGFERNGGKPAGEPRAEGGMWLRLRDLWQPDLDTVCRNGRRRRPTQA